MGSCARNFYGVNDLIKAFFKREGLMFWFRKLRKRIAPASVEASDGQCKSRGGAAAVSIGDLNVSRDDDFAIERLIMQRLLWLSGRLQLTKCV